MLIENLLPSSMMGRVEGDAGGLNVRAMLGGMFGWMVDVFDLTLVLFIASVLGEYFFPPTNLIARCFEIV